MAEPDPTPESDQIDGAAHPREARALIGQGAAARDFLEAWKSGRLPHAWLLSGPQGVGKATFAYHAARALLRNSAVPPDLPAFMAQPADAVYARINAQGHGNLMVLRRPWDAKSKRLKTVLPVDEIRRTARFFRRTASEDGWRICILDSADDMNRNAANALLKILEEPPERALIFVLSDAPNRLLPTIRSRCRRLTFPSLPAADLAAILDQQGLESSTLDLLELAGGSAGRTIRLARSGGLALHRALCAALDNPGAEKTGALAFSQIISGKDANQNFSMFTEFLKDILIDCAKIAQGISSAHSATGPRRELVEKLARQHPLDCWPSLWDKASQLAVDAEIYNLNRQQAALVILDHITGVSGPT